MNSINDLIDLLDSKGVSLSLDGEDNLAIKGDRNYLDHSLIEEIRKYKSQIIAVLQGYRPFTLLSEDERSTIDDGIEDAYPLSALQAGMVFHTQLEQFNGTYHDIMAEHVKCPWDRTCFERALASCMQEHPILRSGFRLDGERPLQQVYATMTPPLVVEDLRGQSETAQTDYLAQWTQAHKQHVFDWEHGPLFHIHIFRRTDDSFEFVISFHHAVLDGWSRAALTTVLYNRYEQLLSGNALASITVDRTYRDFIALEQAVLTDPAATAHFAAMLEEAPGLQLPRRANASGYTQARHEVEGFAGQAEAVLTLAQRLGVSVPSVLLAAHVKVLSLLSGQSRVLSCATYNGRPEQLGAERGLGLFLNSLPLCMTLASGSWKDLIDQVSAQNTANLAHRRYPLSRIQQDSGRTFSEVLFNYTHFHVYNDLTQGEQTLETLGSTGFEQTNFDLLVDIARATRGDAMRLALVYNAEVFDAAMIAQWGDYYVRALEQLLAAPDADHRSRSLLNDAELQQLLSEGRSVTTGYVSGQCLHELFEAQVAQHPEAMALVYDDQTLSYGELDAQANQLAHYLRVHGVGPDSLVGLCVERSLAMVVGILGILKAGGAYVPLDPGYPAERLAYMLDDSAPVVVVTQASVEARLPATSAPVIRLDSDAAMLATYPITPLSTASLGLRADHLAYVIYTSGSTGKPKGVLVEHRHVQRLLSATEAWFGFDAQDVWTLFHSYAFDFSVWELWGALAYGGRLVVVPSWVTRSPEDFYALLQQQQVTVLNQTPTAFMQLAQVDAQRKEALALRAVVFGGEALNLAELKDWVIRHGDDAPVLVNMYGITETTVHVTYRRIRAEDIARNQGSLIGRPLDDLTLYVLDDRQGLAPLGTPGEMYVGGGGVSRGYLRRDALTAERFIANPHVPGERLYRTGDLGRYVSEGELEYLGRIDAQVKIRGFRIELGEIEQQLSNLPGVHSSVVLAREDEPGRKRLVAYVVPSDGSVDATAYREGLLAVLPDYMVPAVFVLLEALPLTPNGKVDRRALPAPAGHEGAAPYVAPRTATEDALCEVWAEVLRHERVGVQDNYFSLGGDSILSIRIVSLLKQRGLAVNVKDIFQYQTIVQLAPWVIDHTTSLINKLSQGAVEQKERLSAEGKDIEEGVF